MPPAKTPQKPAEAEGTKPTEAEGTDKQGTAQPTTDATENGAAEISQAQMTAFLLGKAKALKEEKEIIYKRIQFNREQLRAQLLETGTTDEQKKEINSLYPMKKGGGRKKNTDTPATTAS
ncbi:MAG TPA: hypothetical protein VM715_12790 [Candidatus Acidoferrum sp.]|nr:hypothetical protein [Candidatus Acidoferrum sp.]